MESANAPPLPWEATKHKAFPSVSIEASSSAGEQRAKPPMELPRQLLKDELDKITRWQIGEAATARAGALPSCAPLPCLGALPGAVAAPAGWLPLSLGAAASLSGVRIRVCIRRGDPSGRYGRGRWRVRGLLPVSR